MTELTSPQDAVERRATVRIDAAPGGRRFEGVWLEHADGSRWVIDDRTRALWMWFVDREVIVTGGCYEPVDQAISATHFRVATLHAATSAPGVAPYLSIGPEQVIDGEIATESGPRGSKAAGSARRVFRGADGVTYGLANEQEAPRTGPVRVRARVLAPDMSYTARASGPDLWIVSVHDTGSAVDATGRPPSSTCP